MTETLFPFLCPQGHLLHGDPSQVGSLCACPVCGTQIIVPAPAPHDSAEQPASSPPPLQVPSPSASPITNVSASKSPPAGETKAAETEITATIAVTSAEPELYHIPCPQGHELETPRDMLEKFAMCPQCGEKFRLRRVKSIEYRHQQEGEEELRLKRQERFWTRFAIGVLTLCLLVIALLVLLSSWQ